MEGLRREAKRVNTSTMLNIIYLNKLKSLAAPRSLSRARGRNALSSSSSPSSQPFRQPSHPAVPLCEYFINLEDAAQWRPNFIPYLCLPATTGRKPLQRALPFSGGGDYDGGGGAVEREMGERTASWRHRKLGSIRSLLEDTIYSVTVDITYLHLLPCLYKT